MHKKSEFMLQGLDCPNCAAKIEKNISKMGGISAASVNFMTKTLVVESAEEVSDSVLFTNIESTVKNLEPDVKIRKKSEKVHNHENPEVLNKYNIIKYCMGVVFFAAGLIFDLSFWPKFAVFFISYILIGGDVVIKAVTNIFKGNIFDENFLMVTATVGAFAIGEFSEAVAVMTFYKIGELFQEIAVNRSRKSITALMDIRPDFANLKKGDTVEKVSPEEVNPGDIIIIKPGEKIPLDAIVLSGSSAVDTSALTGESLPREVGAGEEILSGTINLSGLLTAETTKGFGESTVSRILELVQNATGNKARTENFITKFARFYTPAVVLLAAAIALVPPLFTDGSFSEWLYRALVFLVISCPCALVISIPLGFFGGIGGASKNGILIKGSNYLEALYNVDTVVFDKTGTLTQNKFKVEKIKSYGAYTNEELLEYGAYAEKYSTHPIGTSIRNEFTEKIDETQIKNYRELAGYGIKTDIKGKTVLAGNKKLMEKFHIPINEEDIGGTVVHIAIDGVYVGCIEVADTIKPDSANAIKDLYRAGVKKIVMLTGDNKYAAEKTASILDIDRVYSDLLPEGKLEKLEILEKENTSKGSIVFVGDGINDSPILARADVGVAMGGIGSDAAIEAADVVLMTDEPSKLITALNIAKRTRRIVLQNIVLTMLVKAAVLALGAGGMATMWEAVFADVGVALIAILNAMRVMKKM